MAMSSEVGRSLASLLSRVNCVLPAFAFAPVLAEALASAGLGGSAATAWAAAKQTSSTTRFSLVGRFDRRGFDIGAILAGKTRNRVPRHRRQEPVKYMPPADRGQL